MSYFFFFNDTATTEIYTLSLHDALPIWEYIRRKDYNARRKQQEDDFLSSANSRWKKAGASSAVTHRHASDSGEVRRGSRGRDRKSTRLNSSHGYISYAVFCLKKKKNKRN